MKHNVITESTILLWKYVTLLFQGMTPTQSKNNSLKKKKWKHGKNQSWGRNIRNPCKMKGSDKTVHYFPYPLDIPSL